MEPDTRLDGTVAFLVTMCRIVIYLASRHPRCRSGGAVHLWYR